MKNEVKRKTVISLICGRLGSVFISTVVRGIENRINETKEYRVEIYSSDSSTPDDAGKSIEKIIEEKNSDGIIVISSTPKQNSLKQLKKSKIPAVFIERDYNGHNSVIVDNFKAGYNAGKYLIEKAGRKKIGVILDPQIGEKNSATFYRYEGFKKALNESKNSIKDVKKTYVKHHTIEDGRRSFDMIYKNIKKIDGIFSIAGDMAAIGFIHEAKSHGINFPDDIAIIGFDDVEMASALEPPLTTIRQPILKMGEEAVNILNDVFKGKIKKPVKKILDSELIIRETA
ncbi:MAG TPA: substrate-binding domain-containing protein [Candidatus Goldiibacteriota bacterium]|nr:substrate-binding domain-containing protein [Candidatus Goldiibacteriota bacterium]